MNSNESFQKVFGIYLLDTQLKRWPINNSISIGVTMEAIEDLRGPIQYLITETPIVSASGHLG